MTREQIAALQVERAIRQVDILKQVLNDALKNVLDLQGIKNGKEKKKS